LERKGSRERDHVHARRGWTIVLIYVVERTMLTVYFSTDMLLFVICGGLIFEALRLVFGFFG
jgi:hypothetical protein